MRSFLISTIALLIVLSFSGPAMAQASKEVDAQAYAKFYGDGMRDYAEGRNDAAIANFYRAYALRPSRLLLKLIVRTHDFMGHCSAASRQLELFETLHPESTPPTLQLCRAPGSLEIACETGVEEVVVDDMIRVRCGQQLTLPPGTHKVRSVQGGPVDIAMVKADETSKVDVRAGGADRSYEKVPLLDDDERYLVIRSPDGLYQLWVRTPLRNDPDIDPRSGPSGFTVLKGADGLYHISSDDLRGVDSEKTDTGAKGPDTE